MRSSLMHAAVAAIAVLSLALGGCAATSPADTTATVWPDKVIYHVNDSKEQAVDALRNINNHLSVNPKAKIVVVTHSRGVDFLMEGAKDSRGNPYNIPVEQLKSRGVQFDVCELTVTRRKMSKSQFIPEATYVPSGVAEITRLQQREGYAYLRP